MASFSGIQYVVVFQQTESMSDCYLNSVNQFADATEHLTAMYAQFACAVNKQQQFSSAVTSNQKKSFQRKFQMTPIIPISRIFVSNLVQRLLRTFSCQICPTN